MFAQGSTLLVIDPFLEVPEIDAFNRISAIFGDLISRAPSPKLNKVQIYFPHLDTRRLSDVLVSAQVGAIIGLGSNFNVTEALPWMFHLQDDLRHALFEKSLPFLGICFSHQLLAQATGGHVTYIRKKKEVKYGRYVGMRRSAIVHPKLRLLFSNLLLTDYWSGNLRDLHFREAATCINVFNEQHWSRFAGTSNHGFLTAKELRLHQFIQKQTPTFFDADVWHEQEVLRFEKDHFAVAARNEQCDFDALVHHSRPIYTVQCHPEVPCGSLDGDRLIRNFIYQSCLS